jgi:large conductance mechanosensitive channel
MWHDFKAFLLKQNALALAIAVVIGAALNKVVTALVDDFIMPVVGAVTPSGAWRTMTLDVGPVKLGVGDFLSALLNFVIVGIVAWRLSKLVPSAPSGPATKSCPRCFADIDARATRCSHCTSEFVAAA